MIPADKVTKKAIANLLVLALLLFCAGCSNQPDKEQLPSKAATSNSVSSVLSNASSNADNKEIVEYALNLAKYFREPVDNANELKNNPHIFEFTINETFRLYKKNNMPLENISKKDWQEEYLIANKDLISVAEILLNSKLPENIYTDPDFQYQDSRDSFLYSPFSAPMFVTELQSVTPQNDGTIHLVISISQIEENTHKTNTYVFRQENNSQWGQVYQLIKIEHND